MRLFEEDPPANIDIIGRNLIENAKKAIIETDKLNPDRDKIIEQAMNQMYTYFLKYFMNILQLVNSRKI